MSDAPKKIVINCETKEVSEIILTSEEIAQLEADAAAAASAKAEADAQAAEAAEAKAALLTKLGITEDEAKLLLA